MEFFKHFKKNLPQQLLTFFLVIFWKVNWKNSFIFKYLLFVWRNRRSQYPNHSPIKSNMCFLPFFRRHTIVWQHRNKKWKEAQKGWKCVKYEFVKSFFWQLFFGALSCFFEDIGRNSWHLVLWFYVLLAFFLTSFFRLNGDDIFWRGLSRVG